MLVRDRNCEDSSLDGVVYEEWLYQLFWYFKVFNNLGENLSFEMKSLSIEFVGFQSIYFVCIYIVLSEFQFENFMGINRKYIWGFVQEKKECGVGGMGEGERVRI